MFISKIYDKYDKFSFFIVRSSHRRCSVKKVLLKILQNSPGKTCVSISFIIKLQVSACSFVRKRFWHMCFPANFAKFLRTPSLQNTSGGFFFILRIPHLSNNIRFMVGFILKY